MREIDRVPLQGDWVRLDKLIPTATIIDTSKRQYGDHLVEEVVQSNDTYIVAFRDGNIEDFTIFHPKKYEVIGALRSDVKGFWYFLKNSETGEKLKKFSPFLVPIETQLESTLYESQYKVTRLGNKNIRIRYRTRDSETLQEFSFFLKKVDKKLYPGLQDAIEVRENQII